MSRGFVRENDQEEAPFIPPRAALPDGVTNYVTPRGLEQLQAERKALEAQRSEARGSEDERRRSYAVIDGKLNLLNERIVTARIVERTVDPLEDVRFGATVTFEHQKSPQRGKQFTFTLVGVDEASVKQQRIAFTSPIARALMGNRTGETVEFKLGSVVQLLKIISIS
ncbi:MAG: GreA/GreB family elongation factor [Flavobacteriales bacterium]|nr:GreA/GreB family elongation factor [Flavobacteriales bacterium]